MRVKTVVMTDDQLPENLGAIGYSGDINVTELRIVGANPSYQYKLDLQHETGVKNVLDLLNNDGALSVIFDSNALIPSGRYRVQLRTVGDTVWHSNQAWLTIYESINAADFFDPVPAEMHQIERRVTDAANAADTAQRKAECAQNAAEDSKAAAESAQKQAESAQKGATSAQLAAETAQSVAKTAAQDVVKLLDDITAHRYDAFATDTQSGNLVVYTAVGSDGIPLKELVTRRAQSGAAFQKLTIRHLSKNLFNPSLDEFAVGRRINKDGSTSNDSTVAHSKNYTPVLPNTDYVFSGRVNSSAKTTFIAFYDKQKNFLYRYDPGHTGPCHFKTPGDCHFIRYNARSNTNFYKEVQLEVGSVASAFEAYDAEDYVLSFKNSSGGKYFADVKDLDVLTGTGISYSGDTFCFDPPKVTTKLGSNYFFVVEGSGEDDSPDKVATLDATLRLDPTLVYEKLKAAVVAAGST
ncbi:MAG: hypothetical protein IJD20_05180 [Oscillospiraceae bacterium]|nr:hypothetical protein [Oscillospiraceae bacterium]